MDAPMRELLTWVDHAPRTYIDAMTAWGSHCPRFTIWEDALEANFVRVTENHVCLTPYGLAALRAERTPAARD